MSIPSAVFTVLHAPPCFVDHCYFCCGFTRATNTHTEAWDARFCPDIMTCLRNVCPSTDRASAWCAFFGEGLFFSLLQSYDHWAWVLLGSLTCPDFSILFLTAWSGWNLSRGPSCSQETWKQKYSFWSYFSLFSNWGRLDHFRKVVLKAFQVFPVCSQHREQLLHPHRRNRYFEEDGMWKIGGMEGMLMTKFRTNRSWHYNQLILIRQYKVCVCVYI